LPVLRLYHLGTPTYKKIEDKNAAGVWLQLRAPFRTIRLLAVALRDLHREVRDLMPVIESQWLDRPPSEERDAALNGLQEGLERIQVSLVAVLVLLRRVPDDLIHASAPFLFEHLASAPRDLKKAIKAAQKGTLAELGPICDLDVLTPTLLEAADWLSRLRHEDGESADGARDIVVHDEHILQVGPSGTGFPEDEGKIVWKIDATLVRIKKEQFTHIDLFETVRDCLDGLCKFMEGLYKSATPLTDYERGDVVFLSGHDNDIVGFWPPIAGGCSTFPLMK